MNAADLAPNNAQAIIDITRDATGTWPIEGHPDLLIVTDSDGTRIEDLTEHAPHPRRTIRAVNVWDADSFLAYVARHTRPQGLEVWADEERRTITAVINGPEASTPGWCDHTCTLSLRLSPAWRTWVEQSGKLLTQTVFAEHIEDNLPDIVRPAGAEMLELAQTFQAQTKANFTAHRFLDNGMRALEYTETSDAKAGRRGQIEIPANFDLGLRPFLGGDPYKVSARLRWRITDGDLRIGYKLDRPDEVLRAAFGEIVVKIGEGVPVRVNEGRP